MTDTYDLLYMNTCEGDIQLSPAVSQARAAHRSWDSDTLHVSARKYGRKNPHRDPTLEELACVACVDELAQSIGSKQRDPNPQDPGSSQYKRTPCHPRLHPIRSCLGESVVDRNQKPICSYSSEGKLIIHIHPRKSYLTNCASPQAALPCKYPRPAEEAPHSRQLQPHQRLRRPPLAQERIWD